METEAATSFKQNSPNRYSSLIHTLPHYIIPGHGNREEENEAVSHLNRKIKKYSTIALEYGSGSGEHLIRQAKSHPEVLFVGFELRYKRSYRTAEKALEQEIDNLFVIRNDARKAPEYFGPTSVSTIYINFPDPWWKKRRWKKHRLIDESLLKQAADMLVPGGILSYKTDHSQYFSDVLQLLNQSDYFSLKQSTFDLHQGEHDKENILSEFEKLFLYKNIPICFLEAVRK